MIQTWTPDNDVINLAARQDYDTFYEEEREMRRMLRFPPFLDLFRITLSGPEETQVLRACAVIRRSLEPWVKPRQQGPEGPEVLGPAPGACFEGEQPVPVPRAAEVPERAGDPGGPRPDSPRRPSRTGPIGGCPSQWM